MIIIGDVREKLKELPNNSVQCVVTSPPYFGLRDYGIEGQLGLEPTMQEYIANMVEVFREVRRVLRDDGVCFLNLGDSYAGKRGNSADHPGFDNKAAGKDGATLNYNYNRISNSLKPKDLCGIPWRVALALQDDGWWLRSDIIWSKPNPMPESVTDRPTKSHEFIFLLTKSSKYFWDQEAVKCSVSGTAHRRGKKDGSAPSMNFKMQEPGQKNINNTSFQSYMKDLPPEAGRNLRTVWTIPTEAFSEAHFATFPQKLVEICIKTGTSEWGCCPECGSPWGRVVEKTGNLIKHHWAPGTQNKIEKAQGNHGVTSTIVTGYSQETQTLGFKPSCTCGRPNPVPCTVLDPFLGSGTTGLVAQKMGRNWIGIELKPEYAAMAEKRIGVNLFRQESIR